VLSELGWRLDVVSRLDVLLCLDALIHRAVEALTKVLGHVLNGWA
jgi:hypothetical protein